MKSIITLIALICLSFVGQAQSIHCDSLDNNLRYVTIEPIKYTPIFQTVYIDRLYFKIVNFEPKGMECAGTATTHWWLKFPDNVGRYQVAMEGDYTSPINQDGASLHDAMLSLLYNIQDSATYKGFDISIEITAH